jgi:glucose-1-phosphate adenylyltransferase
MSLLDMPPALDLYDATWPVRTYAGQHPPAVLRAAGGVETRVTDSVVSPGCVLEGATLCRAVLSPGVSVGAGARVEDSILLPGVRIEPGAVVRRAVVDVNVVVPSKVRIGCDAAADARRFSITPANVVVVAEGAVVCE